MKVLSCRSHTDQGCSSVYWWFNFYRPEDWLDKETAITLILNGKDANDKIGTITIPLNAQWRERIQKPQQSIMKGHRTIKVYVRQKKLNGEFSIYFGKARWGTYPVELQKDSI